jgi:hypothetical protein
LFVWRQRMHQDCAWQVRRHSNVCVRRRWDSFNWFQRCIEKCFRRDLCELRTIVVMEERRGYRCEKAPYRATSVCGLWFIDLPLSIDDGSSLCSLRNRSRNKQAWTLGGTHGRYDHVFNNRVQPRRLLDQEHNSHGQFPKRNLFIMEHT